MQTLAPQGDEDKCRFIIKQTVMLAESLKVFFPFLTTKWSQSEEFSSQVPWRFCKEPAELDCFLKGIPTLSTPNPLQSVPAIHDETVQEVSYWELSSLTQVLFPQAIQVFGVLQSFHFFSLFSLQKVHRSEVRHPQLAHSPTLQTLLSTQFLFH